MKFETVEYKSFNTNYMIWLMSNKGAVELYEQFSNENFDSILSMFVEQYTLKEGEELQQLRSYIKNLAQIFSNANDNGCAYSNNACETTSCAHTVATYVKEEAIISTTPAQPQMNFNFCDAIPEYFEENVMSSKHDFDIFDISANMFAEGKNVKSFNENCFESNEDLGKMFNNSFDDGYIFCDE